MKLKNLLIGMSVMAFAASCTNDALFSDNLLENDGNAEVTVQATVTPLLPQNATRTTGTLDEGGVFSSTWNEEESVDFFTVNTYVRNKIRIINNKSSDDQAAVSIKKGNYVVSVYPSGLPLSGNTLKLNLGNITQSENTKNPDLSAYDLKLAGPINLNTKSSIRIPYTRKYSLICINLTDLPTLENSTWRYMNISNVNGEKVFARNATINLDDRTVTCLGEDKINTVTVNFEAKAKEYFEEDFEEDFEDDFEEDFEEEEDETFKANQENLMVYLPVLPMTTGILKCELVAINNQGQKKVYTYFFPSVTVEEGKYVIVNKLEYNFVDLGLPSGNLWADRNLGATTETENGKYYAWGNPNCMCSIHKIVTPATSQEKYEDPATYNIGEGFATPTHTQWQELLDNCWFVWADNIEGTGGNRGYFVFATDDNTKKGKFYDYHSFYSLDLSIPHIFLPAGGRMGGGASYSTEDATYYWASDYSDTKIAWHFTFTSREHFLLNGWSGHNNSYGSLIRPIISVKE